MADTVQCKHFIVATVLNDLNRGPVCLKPAEMNPCLWMCDAVRGFLLWTSPSEGHQGRRADQEVRCSFYFC